MPPTYEVQILGIGKKPVRDCFVCTSPHFAKILARDKYGDWIRFGEVKEVLTKAQKKAKAEEAAVAQLLSRAEARQPQSKCWQQPEQHRRNSQAASPRLTRSSDLPKPAKTDPSSGYLWG